MKIEELISVKNIEIYTGKMNKDEVISKLVSRLFENGIINEKNKFSDAIYQRENEISTAVGYGVAIPHAKDVSVNKSTIAVVKNLSGIQWGDQNVNLVFMIAAQKDASDEHLSMLSKISTMLMDEVFRAKLLTSQSKQDMYDTLIKEDERKENSRQVEQTREDTGKYLIGVTSCNTGIAHTFMAAEALNNEARKRGMRSKIQTNGSIGVENKLTPEDVDEANAIIIAHDVKIDTSIFGEKQYVDVPVKKAIDDPKSLVDQALKMDSVGKKKNNLETAMSKGEEVDKEKSSFSKEFYTHIMSGVAYMIPFVVVGGIFIAISFMFGIYASDPSSSQYNIWAAFFNEMGGNSAFKLYVPVLSGFIAWSIADKAALAPGMITGLMAVNGGSGFLGGMVSGFLSGYITKFIVNKSRKIPQTYQGLFSVLVIPLVSTFIVGLVMFFVLNTPMSDLTKFLTTWLKSMRGANAAVLGALLAGMMASDMGGPINKTASAFGLAMFASKIYEPSAALMVGGMVPPLGLALATLIFKNKFTIQEREAGKANWILGASFITEGAIPFAASDPLRVIPANIIGGAIGGAICMVSKISLQAPHGGIFVIPIACNKPFLYTGCIILGSIITALIIGFSKKTLSADELNKKMTTGLF